MTSTAKIPRQKHRGVPADERRALRRQQLLKAAIAVYGRVGFRHATVKAVCEAANLTERYFYESFPNSQALLVAAFEAITTQFHSCLADAAATVDQPGAPRVRAILAQYFERLVEDSTAARVFLVEIAGVGGEVDLVLNRWLAAFADLLERAWGASPTASDTMLKVGVAGGLNRMGITWVAAGYDRPVDEVVTSALKLTSSLSQPIAGSRF